MERHRGIGFRVFQEEREEAPPVVADIERLAQVMLAEFKDTGEALASIKALTQSVLGDVHGNTAKLDELFRGITALAEGLGVQVVTKQIEMIRYQYALGSGVGVRMYENSPFTGHITSVTIHWPGGCNALVDIAIWHGTRQFCPGEGYLALNDATPQYDFNEPVNKDEEIWVDLANASAFSHTITVTVSVKEA
ncbi:hypothetical protein LCGC14_2567400 [marine sediment metagenome]|uniref:Uncharacterized protein n=1 Tax=marine sediment metagenome TaxID=412755 RepID=A0A0F9AIS0_9ZZZZ